MDEEVNKEMDKRVILVVSIIIAGLAIITADRLINTIQAKEVGVVSEEKKKALEEGRTGKEKTATNLTSPKILKHPLSAVVGLTPEGDLTYKTSRVPSISFTREALSVEDPETRLIAATFIMYNRKAEEADRSLALPVITEIAQDSNVNDTTRILAIKVLGRIGEIRILEGLLTDENEYIRQKAKEVLERTR
jgi:hypothetical protein